MRANASIKMTSRYALLASLALSFLFWVGYGWPEDEIVIEVKGVTAGRVFFDSDERAEFLVWDSDDLDWIDGLHPDLWDWEAGDDGTDDG